MINMRVTSIKCDICERATGDHGTLEDQELGFLELAGSSRLTDLQAQGKIKYGEVCPTCTRKIFEFVQSLRPRS